MMLVHRVILSFLSDRYAGIDLSKVKTDPSYASILKDLRAEWQHKGMQAVVPNEKMKEKILSTVAYVGHKNPDKFKQSEGKIFDYLHDIAVVNKLSIFDKYDSSVTFEKFMDDLEAIKHELSTGTKLTPEELKIFNRVKVDKDFGDGWQWVYAVDEKGEPVGHMPSSVCNKTMGHCGNQTFVKRGDVYYELRHNNKPYLTVILDADSKIKESKGPHNAPPKEKELVAPKMKWFMTHERVKGTSYESGYARDRNFSILQFLEHDPEFVSEVEEKHPHLINEKVDKPILEYRKALKEGRITEEEIIEKWESNDVGMSSGGLRLEHLRGILRRTPFDESELVGYINSGRLSAIEIANTDHKYLTPDVQKALLEKDRNSDRVFIEIINSVPGIKITKESMVKIFSKYPSVVGSLKDGETQIKVLSIPEISSVFVKSLQEYPRDIGSLKDGETQIKYLSIPEIGAAFAKSLQEYPGVIESLKDGETQIKVLSIPEIGSAFAKGLQEHPRDIDYISSEIRDKVKELLETYKTTEKTAYDISRSKSAKRVTLIYLKEAA